MNTKERYRTDPIFASLVSTLRQHIIHGAYTPTELREAAILASIMHAEENVHPGLTISLPYTRMLEEALQTIEKITREDLRNDAPA